MSFSVSTHEYQGSGMLNICDEELLGRTMREGGRVLAVTREYYGGRTVGEREAERMLASAAVVNMAGRRTVELALRAGVGARGGEKTVEGVPFMIVFRM